jgi:hypothetical protein
MAELRAYVAVVISQFVGGGLPFFIEHLHGSSEYASRSLPVSDSFFKISLVTVITWLRVRYALMRQFMHQRNRAFSNASYRGLRAEIRLRCAPCTAQPAGASRERSGADVWASSKGQGGTRYAANRRSNIADPVGTVCKPSMESPQPSHISARDRPISNQRWPILREKMPITTPVGMVGNA